VTEQSDNLPELVHQTAVEIPVAEFEGEMVRLMHGKMPGITLEMDYGYKRDTHLKLEIEVRVRSVTVDEVRSGGNKGDLVRIHEFAIEEAKILGAYTSEQLDEGVGGSASVGAQKDIENDEMDDRPEGADDGAERPDEGPGDSGAGDQGVGAGEGADGGPDPGF
jgi:hypothetical protein